MKEKTSCAAGHNCQLLAVTRHTNTMPTCKVEQNVPSSRSAYNRVLLFWDYASHRTPQRTLNNEGSFLLYSVFSQRSNNASLSEEQLFRLTILTTKALPHYTSAKTHKSTVIMHSGVLPIISHRQTVGKAIRHIYYHGRESHRATCGLSMTNPRLRIEEPPSLSPKTTPL